MRYIFPSLMLLCFSASGLFAQNTLKGTITDNDQAPLSYILISVTRDDSLHTPTAETLTDSTGAFMITVKDTGTYIIHNTATGYEDIKQQVVIKNDTATVYLQARSLHNTLRNVTVRAQRPTIVRKVDRVTMNVEDNPIVTGKSAGEVLALAPGIFIKDGTITINGTTGARVMVNNKLLQLSGDELINYLASLRAEDIKSIEIIPHPPAEYDAEGTGGLINIILKKNRTAGLNGSAYAAYKQGRYAGTNEGIQLNFKKGKWGASANYAFNTMKAFQSLDQERNFPDNGIYTAANRAIKYNTNNYLHAGLTYDISEAQYISLDYTYSGYNGREHWASTAQISYPENTGKNLTTRGLFPNVYDGGYNDIGLNYRRNTDKAGSNFSFLADYITNTGRTTNNVQSAGYDHENVFMKDTAFRNATPSEATIITAEAKYTKAFSRRSNLGFGAKLSHTAIHNVAHFEYADKKGSWLSNEAQDFTYDYKEQILAGFVNYNTTILHTNVQAGLRGENTSFAGTLWQLNNNAKTKRHYFGLFPSIYLQKNLDSAGNHSLTLSYNRRLSRPDFESLDPHIAYIDNYTSGLGNPYLNPQYSDAYEINYTFRQSYNLGAGYTYTRGIINNVMHTAANNPEQMVQQPINAGNKRAFSLTAFLPVSITKWWTTQNVLQYNYEAVTAPQYAIHRNIIFIQTMQDISLPHQLRLTLSAHYMSNYIFANALIAPIFNTDIAIQKKAWKDRLTLKAGLEDVFHTRKEDKGTFYYNQFTMNFTERQQSRVLTLGIVYNFKTGKAFHAHNIESSNDDEKSRLGQ
ncbi:MAG TPA: outer membrane beta-barrel family protein [Edaphocola sp.]|nr:outer membrane beta-barrel family protein [Edaphocola sp.]